MNVIRRQEKIVLVCGYRRTGKDTLYSILSENNLDRVNTNKTLDLSNLFKWRIYREPSKLTTNIKESGSKRGSEGSSIADVNMSSGHIYVSYLRKAFADALKRETSEVYEIPLVISDAEKDIKQFTHYKSKELVSARDIYIEWGRIRRSEDVDYWCKAAFTNIPEDENITCVVTDWRYRNEVKYVLDAFENVVTVRIYRSDVPEPDMNIDSEHDLDKYVTDILLIEDGKEGEFEKTIERFPQYKDYVGGECIN